jgi:26S proteasome regulatory subunit N1
MDKLILGSDQGSKWMYKNKDRGIMSAAASLGTSPLDTSVWRLWSSVVA